jgi:hypothetical protein
VKQADRDTKEIAGKKVGMEKKEKKERKKQREKSQGQLFP